MKESKLKEVLIVDDDIFGFLSGMDMLNTNGQRGTVSFPARLLRLEDYENNLRDYNPTPDNKTFDHRPKINPELLSQFNLRLQKRGIELSTIGALPFDANQVIKCLENVRYDILLLDLGFPVDVDLPRTDTYGEERALWEGGGIAVAKYLREQGKKFTFFTGDISHAQNNLERAVAEGVLSKDQLQAVWEKYYQKNKGDQFTLPIDINKTFILRADPIWDPSSPVISPAGDLTFFGKCAFSYGRYCMNDEARERFFDCFAEIVKKADAYQNPQRENIELNRDERR